MSRLDEADTSRKERRNFGEMMSDQDQQTMEDDDEEDRAISEDEYDSMIEFMKSKMMDILKKKEAALPKAPQIEQEGKAVRKVENPLDRLMKFLKKHLPAKADEDEGKKSENNCGTPKRSCEEEEQDEDLVDLIMSRAELNKLMM